MPHGSRRAQALKDTSHAPRSALFLPLVGAHSRQERGHNTIKDACSLLSKCVRKEEPSL